MKINFVNLVLVYSLLVFSANIVYPDSVFSGGNFGDLQEGELKKLIIPKDNVTRKSFNVKDMKDANFELNLADGKLRIINFWATWCAPCIRELPSLKTLKNLINDDKFEIIMIAAGRNSVAQIEKFIIEGQLFKLKSYRDPYGELSASLGVLGLPTTLIIGPNGREIGRIIGDINWSSDESVKFFKELLHLYDQ